MFFLPLFASEQTEHQREQKKFNYVSFERKRLEAQVKQLRPFPAVQMVCRFLLLSPSLYFTSIIFLPQFETTSQRDSIHDTAQRNMFLPRSGQDIARHSNILHLGKKAVLCRAIQCWNSVSTYCVLYSICLDIFYYFFYFSGLSSVILADHWEAARQIGLRWAEAGSLRRARGFGWSCIWFEHTIMLT